MSGTQSNPMSGPQSIPSPSPRIQPAFLEGFTEGRRFGVWVEPPEGVATLGAILCIQPFGDEATLARRVLAAQARRLALRGWTTLIVDPYGTGDSDGATGDATLALWREDLMRARIMARERTPGRFVLWGTRMGALLAAALMEELVVDNGANAIVLWQPPPNGAALIDPLLKLAQVGAVARDKAARAVGRDQAAGATDRDNATGAASSNGGAVPTTSVASAASRAAAADHACLLLAGYLLRRDLVDELAALSMRPPAASQPASLPSRPNDASCPILMLGIQRVLAPGGAAPKALTDLARAWAQTGREPTLRAVQGEPFWSSLEPSMPLAAFEATEAFLDQAAGP